MSNTIEAWIGLECTVNRVGDRFINQCEKNNHISRINDLEKFAALGAARIRYPALWELVAPDSAENYNWSWLDQRFFEIKRVGLSPIAGLVHHGSGPKYTNLLDPLFPEKLAKYARAFAERYPWIDAYTPLNEIQTTTFFSCLYGFWYPHKKNDRDTVFALYNQTRATALAMREIRQVNPQALLIQTEDIGRCQSTPKLDYQKNFQNERRWLGYDFLCGKINAEQKIYSWLKNNGFTDQQMYWLHENTCSPDILGVNHYILSNRFLDHRLNLHPEWSHGGNGIDCYADVGAIDTDDVETPAPGSILQEVWDRYQLPVAVTETHLNGPRETQMRWLKQVWTEAHELKENGVNIKAVTAWSLLGTYDWNSLCLNDTGFYEPGVFDLRTTNDQPRKTALAEMIRQYAQGKPYDHPVLDQPGWWKKSETGNFRKIAITGGNGTLAQAFARICERRRIPFVLLDRNQMDIADEASVQKTMAEINPWAVINAAGYVKVDLAEHEKEKCFRENVVGPTNLAHWCADKNIPFVTFSSDLVFDGKLAVPYKEMNTVSPLNTYGHSKAMSEKKVLDCNSNSLVIRTSSFFGPWDKHNFVTQTLIRLAEGKQVRVPRDTLVSPTFVPDLVDTSLDLLIDGEKGLVHLTNTGAVTWGQLAQLAAQSSNKKMGNIESLIIESTAIELKYFARRPKNSALTSERFKILPTLESAVERYIHQLEVPY